jgi:hypothetical protein
MKLVHRRSVYATVFKYRQETYAKRDRCDSLVDEIQYLFEPVNVFSLQETVTDQVVRRVEPGSAPSPLLIFYELRISALSAKIFSAAALRGWSPLGFGATPALV